MVEAAAVVIGIDEEVISVSELSTSIEVTGVVMISSVNEGAVLTSVDIDVNGFSVLEVSWWLLSVEKSVSWSSLTGFVGVDSVKPAL